MLRRLSGAAALCLLMASGAVHALGLGEIKVSSGLNQRFAAVIPVTSLSPGETGNLRARIAGNEDFARAGLERSSYLSSIQVETIADGPNPRIELRSRELAREPMLTLLVEVRTAGGGPRVLREYTVFLDPPVSTRAPAPAARPESPPVASPAPAASEFFQTPEEVGGRRTPAVDTPAPAPVAMPTPLPRTYGPVRAGQSLRTVAQAVKPAGVGLEQAMLALYEANPRAFIDGDINTLRRDVRLEVPAREAMLSRSNAEARARIAELAAPPVVAEAPMAAPAPSATAPEPAPAAAVVPPGPADPVPPASPTADPATPDAAAPPVAEVPAEPETAEVPPPGDALATPPPVDADEEPATGAPPVPAAKEPAGADLIEYMVPGLAALIALLIAIAAWRVLRERRAKREYEEASRLAAKRPPPSRADDVVAAVARPASARAELEAIDRSLDEPPPGTPESPLADGPLASAVAAAAVQDDSLATAPDAAEQAVNEQFQSDAKEIKLGDNDPLSEADFHLAYGLYDEAALLLQQASARDPERAELRVKLAETYFAAGRAAEFEQTAASLKDQVPPEDWSKLATMGRQIAPASPLFAGDVAPADNTPLDLSFDEEPPQVVAPPVVAPPAKVDDGLEFNLEELELPTPAAPAAEPAPRSDATLEFDLGEFDLGANEPPKPAAAQDLELEDFDLGGLPPASPQPPSGRDADPADTDPLVLDDPLGDEALSPGDDAATKLDLARAYVEMGDAEMARSLLDEVAEIGTDDQKREAGELRARLLG